jgi:hypothetical protein
VTLAGKCKYQSYRPDPGSLASDSKTPTFIAWSPYGIGEVTIDAGESTGTLEFKGTKIKLGLTVKVAEGSPQKVLISASMNLAPSKYFTNELEGWVVPAKLDKAVDKDNPLIVRGSIVQTSEDIATPPQPKFTAGFFVLEPLK